MATGSIIFYLGSSICVVISLLVMLRFGVWLQKPSKDIQSNTPVFTIHFPLILCEIQMISSRLSRALGHPPSIPLGYLAVQWLFSKEKGVRHGFRGFIVIAKSWLDHAKSPGYLFKFQTVQLEVYQYPEYQILEDYFGRWGTPMT